MATTQTNSSDYLNGSDLLLSIAGKPVGHCSDFTITYNSETKDRAVKPLATLGKSAGLWKEKGVTGLSISIQFSGLRFYDETEGGYESIASKWGEGAIVEVKHFERGKETTPILVGNFVIDSLETATPAQDDATYSGNMSNSGEPSVYPGKAAA